MKGGTVFFDGNVFYAKKYADNYSKIEAVMLNKLYMNSNIARNFLNGIQYYPENMFNSNALYSNHEVLEKIYYELSFDQRDEFIIMLSDIVKGRLNTRFSELDKGHANQVILMNNILIFFGGPSIDESLLTRATRPQSSSTDRSRRFLVSREVLRKAADEGSQLTARIEQLHRNAPQISDAARVVARDAAMNATRKNRTRLARDASQQGLKRDVIRGISRKRRARLSRLTRDVEMDAIRRNMQREAAHPESPISTTLKRRITALFNAGTYDSKFTLHDVLISANQWKSNDMFSDDNIIELLHEELGEHNPQTKKRKRD
jgi:hypothetical protein